MLIDFSVQNFRSIKEELKLSMVSTSGKELRATNTFSALDNKLDLVRSAAIYGPNASGKTNLIKAVQTMRRIVLRSAQLQHGDEIGVIPYRFDVHSSQESTQFIVAFINDDVRYEYGFVTTNEQVLEEWLFAYPKGRPQKWIDRKFDQHADRYQWGNMEKLVGTKQLWQDATRSNALFLSTAIQLNNSQLKPVFDWFKMRLKVIPGNLAPSFTIDLCTNKQHKSQIVNFLKAADFHISDLLVESESIEINKLLEDMPLSIRGQLSERLKDSGETEIKKHDIRTVHTGSTGDEYTLAMDEESTGTRKFFAYTGPLLDVLNNGYVLVVDELNDNLHPYLVEFIIQMFHDTRLNCKNAQLIFTTHETSILDQTLLRRDQVWFVDKDDYNATSLYPLSDFSPRKAVENLEKNYLQGRYGAIPYFQTVANVFGVCE